MEEAGGRPVDADGSARGSLNRCTRFATEDGRASIGARVLLEQRDRDRWQFQREQFRVEFRHHLTNAVRARRMVVNYSHQCQHSGVSRHLTHVLASYARLRVDVDSRWVVYKNVITTRVLLFRLNRKP